MNPRDLHGILAALEPLLILRYDGVVSFANERARELFGPIEGRELDLPTDSTLAIPGLGRAFVSRHAINWQGAEAELVVLRSLPEQRTRPGPRAAPEPGRRLVPMETALRSLDARVHSSSALLVVDLDRFHVINAVLGYRTGDELLRQVGLRLASTLRATDLVSRRGEDEFLVVLSARAHEAEEHEMDRRRRRDPSLEAGAVAERVLESLVAPFEIDGSEVYVGASIGIALVHPELDPQLTLKCAESALYRAKELGRTRYELYSGDLLREKSERMAIENRLRQALRRGEFFLAYQPVVELGTSRMVGVEALIRWLSPERGLTSPALFIPMAEENGLIIPIGDWVLQETLRQAALWHAQGARLVVACNVSVAQFMHPDFLTRLKQLLALHRLPPGSIEIEVTETAIMRAGADTDRILAGLEELGLKVAIDDFGVGHSSLSRLKSLRSHLLKLDSSFVHGLPDDYKDASIASAVIELAHNLGMESLAEGIETAAQHECLRDLGCHLGQGYHFGKPAEPEEIERRLRSTRRGRKGRADQQDAGT
ncbi:bifunctional diguanylate cyclase/phosphodiesterase [bacterium CPR1]|nr:bifunctional diguanylate cyclase/phosphodiesterase [bacterium CPR1]